MSSLLLFSAACLGHFILGLAVYNWLYGAVVSEHRSGAVRGVLTLLIAAGPVGYGFAYGFDTTAPLHRGFYSWPDAVLSVYLLICWAVLFVALPAVTIQRLMRKPPPALVGNHCRTVNVAAELKAKPIGVSKRSHYALLPRNEIFQIDLIEKTLVLPQLPAAWDGLTILHLTDLHFCGTPDRVYFERVVELCREWEPDLIALTGDVVDSAWHHRWIVRVLSRLRCKVAAYAILGNHDYRFDVERVRRRLRRAGMRVLVNAWEALEVRGLPMTVIGHEGPWLSPPPELTGCSEEAFRLCLSHTPDHISWARQHRIDLMLAGHVHGGQIRLPVFGSVFVPSRYGRRYDCGVFAEPPTLMHVSRGVAGKHPVRYNCRPEVTLLILRQDRLRLSDADR